MFECSFPSVGRRVIPLLRRQGLILLSLCLGVILCRAPSVEAKVDSRPAKIVMSSVDFPDMVFVVYHSQSGNPWAIGNRVDPATARIVWGNDGVELPFWEGVAVLAVPRALADKTKGEPDPAWLEPAAPGVVRVPGTFQVPHVYRHIVLRYQLDKTDKGPKLTLLNPDDLRSAQQQPVSRPEVSKSQSPVVQWFTEHILFVGGGLVLIAGVLALWLIKRRRP